ncbi:hypothetical protein HOL21_01090 [Candidatus Woesearchaeota archaeon]|nr:hypothetical protein [Candidatus Woesearchaeota archaeon]MBT5396789.1 hypothetical protein [Candidatus Woesearchaeota archaeon]MBT5924671.1 hypothetical protein [Candidatus Woesearchaeota archaeon]MBT6367677.1 hypothetical protein [Candidatus Woesearchaeota archaeon]MBT7762922.1 hypothetical protein [Candidatus Woesearchaeota archaeon]
MPKITEQGVTLNIASIKKDPHKKMPIFYNPVMKSNRNISILLLNSISNTKMHVALPLTGSGIRALRFLRELKKGKIDTIFVNDKKADFVNTFTQALTTNNLKKTNSVKICNDDANHFLLNQHTDDFCGYFDYIDIDPFGTPNPFLSASVSQVKRNGILAITATDTAALTGTYPRSTKRKYWATSLKSYMMHETGLRTLIRKVQLQGIQFDKALTPILSYHKDHYFRIYFKQESGKERCDEIIKQHKYMLYCPSCLNHTTSHFNKETCSCGTQFLFIGPLWIGKLFDTKLITTMAKNNPFPEEQKFLDVLKEESKKDIVGFYDLHVIEKKYKFPIGKMDSVLKKLKAVRTHFSLTGIKTNINIKEIIRLLK